MEPSMMWLVWIVVALVCLAGEAVTTALVLASFAVAAVLVAPLALAIPLAGQVVAFGALSLLMLGVARPAVLRVLPRSEGEEGRPRIGPGEDRALAVGTIDRRQGQIRVGSGEFWTARPVEPDITIEPGREVQIVRMDGLVARVRPVASDNEPARKREATLPVAPAVDESAPDMERGKPIPFGLSAREVEVLRLVALGSSNQEIAERLFLSPRTVHHHVSHILTKMGAANRVEAARLAMEHGLISLREPGD